ncbi:contractile injection system tape measure protein [Janthinobacterium sp.]|uniref:contractile injection system tape measure protein n=1 Tax=Janthinobacterium sp. TaxID=1871054 RepID=UPI0039C89378
MNDAVHSPDIACISNAGLALVHPFLPVLFKRLNLVTGGDDGRSDAPAPQVLLNKLLSGLPWSQAVIRQPWMPAPCT